MAKQRYIKTSFRSDDYIEWLDPSEKLLFLYLLTNDQTNICGIYKITLKRISFETWYNQDMAQKIIDRFSRDKKIFYVDWYIVIKNHLKNQSLNPSTVEWAKREILEIPDLIIDKIQAVHRLDIVCSTLLNFTLPYFTSSNYTKPDDTSSDEEEPKAIEEFGNKDINFIIQTMKQACSDAWLQYMPWIREREFAKHILSKKLAAEIEKYGMSLEEFVANIVKLSAQPYMKPVNTPQLFYQNWGHVINASISQKKGSTTTFAYI